MGQHSKPVNESEESVMDYAKALMAVVATILSAVIAALTGDSVIDVGEWINVAILAAGALAVFSGPNVPGSTITKAVLAVITAVLTLAVNLVAGGLDLTEWLQLGMAALGALGVYAVPNSGSDVVEAA